MLQRWLADTTGCVGRMQGADLHNVSCMGAVAASACCPEIRKSDGRRYMRHMLNRELTDGFGRRPKWHWINRAYIRDVMNEVVN